MSRLTDLLHRASSDKRPTLITGGAGFIGTNVAHRLLSAGTPVIVLDNLSRHGAEANLRWLRQVHRDRVQVVIADVRDPGPVRAAVADASRVFHFAAQTAVTTSMKDPVHDFDVNARGTLMLLEALREREAPPPIVFTSTNKVYGALDDVELQIEGKRYVPRDPILRRSGVDEMRPMQLHTPYGCSKGTAEQYVLDYARTYGLRAIVFRMSCIYGHHQLGTEDQGWVAHFLMRALAGEPISVYGDGRQVRDLLCVDDLVDALLLAQAHMPSLSGKVFNIGGGPDNAMSLLDVIDVIDELHGGCRLDFSGWRSGDQRYYVSDTRSFGARTGWAPTISARDGISELYCWLVARRGNERIEKPSRRVSA
jgi:CDP-paratose 2-epimerase